MTEAELYAFIGRSSLGVLGSICDSCPQAALVGIAVTPQLEIIFDTLDSSRKYRNLTVEPACSFVIGWTGEQSVQFEGNAQLLREPELEPYREIYFRSWPDGRERMNWPGLVYFLVRPKWIRFSDFDQRPAFIQEFRF